VCSKTTANDHHHLSLIFSGDDDLWYNKTHKLAFGEFVILKLFPTCGLKIGYKQSNSQFTL